MAEPLKPHGEIAFPAEMQVKLQTISVSTRRRLLPPRELAAEWIAHRKEQPKGGDAADARW